MFFILSKITSWLLTPLSWTLLVLIASYFIRRNNLRKKLRALGVFMLIFFTNPAISNLAMRWWEVKATEINRLPHGMQLGVVLTGVTKPTQKPTDRVHFGPGADRILHAIQLHHQGVIENLLIAGGSGSLLHPEVSESAGLKKVALMSGVLPEEITVESTSRNTHENAVNSVGIINERWPNQPFLLITSAFHMRRAMACFTKAGLHPVPFSTDIRSVDWEWSPALIIIPSAECFEIWNILIREITGMTAYKAAGYI